MPSRAQKSSEALCMWICRKKFVGKIMVIYKSTKLDSASKFFMYTVLLALWNLQNVKNLLIEKQQMTDKFFGYDPVYC